MPAECSPLRDAARSRSTRSRRAFGHGPAEVQYAHATRLLPWGDDGEPQTVSKHGVDSWGVRGGNGEVRSLTKNCLSRTEYSTYVRKLMYRSTYEAYHAYGYVPMR